MPSPISLYNRVIPRSLKNHESYSKDNKRIIEEMAVINEFEDSKEEGKEAWETFKRLHRNFQVRKYTFFIQATIRLK